MSNQNDEANDSEQLRTPARAIIFANVAHVRRSMPSETRCHALHVHFVRDIYGAGVWEGGGIAALLMNVYGYQFCGGSFNSCVVKGKGDPVPCDLVKGCWLSHLVLATSDAATGNGQHMISFKYHDVFRFIA